MKKTLVIGNGSSWCGTVYGDLNDGRITFNNDSFCNQMPKIDKIIYKISYSDRNPMNFPHLIKLPLYKYYRKLLNEYDRVFLFDWNPLSRDESFLKMVKAMGLYCGLIFTNIFSKSGIKTHCKQDLLKYYDRILVFDKADVEQQGFESYDYSYSVETIRKEYRPLKNPEYDIVFVGKAKERYERIMKIYTSLIAHGFNCFFVLNGVAESDRINNGIIYNREMTYEEVVKLSCNSRCILEVLQDEGTTSTLRLLEAITLNKIFLTDNEKICDDSIFDPLHMFVYNDLIDYERLKKSLFTEFSYEDKYVVSISINNLRNAILRI